MITIAVDAMGGDIGLSVTIPAAVAFLERHRDAHLIMVGDEVQIKSALSSVNAPMSQITIQHASEVVSMDEQPQSALKNKKDSSMRVAVNQVKEGKAQAAVSAGNTGALMATARFVLKTLPGIERPAIAKFLPNQTQGATCVLDLGANIDSTPQQLMQFGVMGSYLVKAMYPQKKEPKVGILNVGKEDIKGTETIKEAYQLLAKTPLNFIGNVEGDDIFTGDVDVIVADGFVGNVTLKAIEGAVKMMGGVIKEEFSKSMMTKFSGMMALPVLKSFKRRFDPRRFNGAIFLGLRGIVVKSHGGTDAIGFNYALQEAYYEAKAEIQTKLELGIGKAMERLAEIEAKQQAEKA